MTIKKITKELLQKWEACADGYNRFNELFPKGADLETAIEGLIKDHHNNWAYWLFNKCKKNNLFLATTALGYRNSGNCNTGEYNSGNSNTGNHNSEDFNIGCHNSGCFNSGYRNSGYYNSGDYNAGYNNSGDFNSEDFNSGNHNSGSYNLGSYNSGDCNIGNRNSGYFNTNTPKVRLFNKDSELGFDSDIIDKLNELIRDKVDVILMWVCSESMTDDEKRDNPSHIATGGYLKKRDYKYCWRESWDGNFTKKDKEFIQALPNFDAKIFQEITGIDTTKNK